MANIHIIQSHFNALGVEYNNSFENFYIVSDLKALHLIRFLLFSASSTISILGNKTTYYKIVYGFVLVLLYHGIQQ